MRTNRAFVTGLLLSASLASPSPIAAAARLHVIATVGDLGAIAREVLGDAGDVVVLAKPTQDPHFVDARPNLMLDLNRAQVLVAMGLDYEIGWLPALVRGSRNPGIQPGAPGYVDASTLVTLREVPQGRIDRSMGDIHPGGNPHFTLDPRNGVRIARGLAERLGALAPGIRGQLARNAEAFADKVQARETAWLARVAAHKGTPVVTYHKSFVYLTGWLGLTEAANLEPKPGIPPSASHVAEVIGIVRARHVPLLLQERWYPASTAELVARETGAHLVLLEGMTPIGGSYVEHLDAVVRAVAAALGGGGAGAAP